MVTPQHDDRVVALARLIQGLQQTTNLAVDKTFTGQIRPHEIAPLVVLPQPLEPDFRQLPVQIPTGPGCISSVTVFDQRKYRIIVGVEIEPLLRGIARHVRQEIPDTQELGLVLWRLLDLCDGPVGDQRVSLLRVIVIERPDSPVDQRVPLRSGGASSVREASFQIHRRAPDLKLRWQLRVQRVFPGGMIQLART